MQNFTTIKDGHKISALICMTDITGFARLSRSEDMETVYTILKDIAVISSKKIEETPGKIIKYIGDAALIIFPDGFVDEGVRVLLDFNAELEGYFKHKGYSNKVTFSLHFGEVILGRLPPFDSLDVFGDTVAIAFMLDRGAHSGRFVISPQVFRKLKPETRKRFHKFTQPVVYLAE